MFTSNKRNTKIPPATLDEAIELSSHKLSKNNFEVLEMLQNSISTAIEYIKEDTGLFVDETGLKISVLDFDVLMQFYSNPKRVIDASGKVQLKDLLDINPARSLIRKLEVDYNLKSMYRSSEVVTFIGEKQIIVLLHSLDTLSAKKLEANVHHELIHIGQVQNYPSYFDKKIDIQKDLLRIERKYGARSKEYFDKLDTFYSRTSFIEAQAYSLGGEEKRNRRYKQNNIFDKFKVFSGPDKFNAILPSMRLALSAVCIIGQGVVLSTDEFPKQVFKLKTAFKRVGDIERDITLMDKMYRNPALVDVLLKSRGSFEITQSLIKSDEYRRLSSMNPNFHKLKAIVANEDRL